MNQFYFSREDKREKRVKSRGVIFRNGREVHSGQMMLIFSCEF